MLITEGIICLFQNLMILSPVNTEQFILKRSMYIHYNFNERKRKMGLLDSIKGIFSGAKTIEEKLAKWTEDRKSSKIEAYTDESVEKEIRLLAIKALADISRDELAVNTCMKLITDDDNDIKLAACESLKKIGTKREVDRLYYVETTEQDPEVKKALLAAAVSSKERSPRFL